MTGEVKIGISACLLGQKVRYDGDDRRDQALIDALGELVEWVPVCPEVEMGLGVPREPMHLEGSANDPRLVTNDTRLDYTEAMKEWGARRISQLREEGLSGFILKNRSPSCGLSDVAIRENPGAHENEPQQLSSGLFARMLMESMSGLTLANVEDLQSPESVAGFIARAEK